VTDPARELSLDATGERLVPEAAEGELVLAEHMARYRLAARLAPGRRALDAACGEGYGTAMLAAAGADVVGVGVDAATVEHARRRYGLDVRVGDVLALPFDDASFDLVVSFETIEHTAEPLRMLDELRRVLLPDGLLLISTPNAREYRIDNEFHVEELEPEVLLDALRTRFPSVRALYQQNFLTSVVVDEDRLAAADPERRVALDVSKSAGVAPGCELYTLALCAVGATLPELEADVGVMASVHEAHALAERTIRAEGLLEEWHARATEAERVQDEWQERATEAERIQRAWQERATEAERQNEDLRASLQRIHGSLLWRTTGPLRALVRRLG
jgi:SAM-dependent methyltransferase